jgi:CMP-N,N'-diacetyllegionaminic acid synthase
MLLAIIPARGGSKGIPKKNLALFNGKPLIEYSIDAAQKSKLIDDVLLSTDSEEIASIGVSMGLDMSYRRPSEIAEDQTSMFDTIEHCLSWFKKSRGQLPDEIILLQPTSPLRTSLDIDAAVEQFRESNSCTLMSVHSMSEHPSECIRVGDIDWQYVVAPPKEAVRRQDYEHNNFFINGAIYIAETKAYLSRRTFIDPRDTEVFVMPRERGLDIDTPLDLVIAESIMKTNVEF